MKFEEACSEIDYILEHMNPVDLEKIPEEVRQFFKDSKSILYKVKLDETKNLYEQELKEETKAFIKILNAKYFNEEEKEELNNILRQKEEIEDKEVNNITTTTEMIVYKKNIFAKLRNFVLKIFKRK